MSAAPPPAVLTDAVVSPHALRAAAATFARAALREHIALGLSRGQLETVLSGVRCLEHLVGLVGPAVAAAAWASACRASANPDTLTTRKGSP